MLKVRLQRVGRKNDPSFRVVVTDSRRGPKSGNYIENLGSYSPRAKSLSLNSDRIKHWIAMGAQVSDTVHNLLVKEKVIDGKSINVLPKKSPVVKKDKDDKEGVGIEAKDTSAHASQAVQGSEEPSGSRREDSKESDESSTEAEETPEETTVAADAPKEEKSEEEDQQKADEPQVQATNAEESTKEEVKAKDVKKEEGSSDDSKEGTATSEEKRG